MRVFHLCADRVWAQGRFVCWFVHFKGLLFPPDSPEIAAGVLKGTKRWGEKHSKKGGLQEQENRIGPKERNNQQGIPSNSVCLMVFGHADAWYPISRYFLCYEMVLISTSIHTNQVFKEASLALAG